MSAWLPRGSLCSFDLKNPTPWGFCDRTGFRANRKDIINELQYNSDGLYWPGYRIHQRYVLKANPQFLVPPLKGDPTPVNDPLPQRFLDDSNS